jgi:hypothetical protein
MSSVQHKKNYRKMKIAEKPMERCPNHPLGKGIKNMRQVGRISPGASLYQKIEYVKKKKIGANSISYENRPILKITEKTKQLEIETCVLYLKLHLQKNIDLPKHFHILPFHCQLV